MAEPLRVVFLTHNYPQYSGDVAGAFLHPLAMALREREVDLRVVTPSAGGRDGREELDGVPVRRIRYASAAHERYAQSGQLATAIRSPQGLRALAGMIRALRRGAREELHGSRRGVVHAHWWFPSGLAAPKDTPLVVTCHGTDVRMLERGALIRWLARGTFRRAAQVTTVSHSLAATLRQSGATVSDDAIVPMPVTLGDRPWTRGGGGVVVLGRLTEQKRVHLAIEAFALARERGYMGHLRIAGDGVTRAALQVLAGGLGVSDAVEFLGAIPPNAVSRLFATADACLMPAVAEGFGLAGAEALMQGVPIVACTDGGGLLDLVPASGGGRHVAPTATAIADGLMDILSDPAARASAQQAGSVWRERLTPAHVADCCLTWYREAVHE